MYIKRKEDILTICIIFMDTMYEPLINTRSQNELRQTWGLHKVWNMKVGFKIDYLFETKKFVLESITCLKYNGLN